MDDSRQILGLDVTKHEAVLIARILFVLLMIGAVGAAWKRQDVRQDAVKVATHPRSVIAEQRAGKDNSGDVQSRAVYPLSVIPGGAYSPEELARARRVDRVVARHYADFGSQPRFERVSTEFLAYVSYRKRDRIYWTRTRRRIPKGELLLVDGHRMARARCGNQVAIRPQGPTETEEPDEDVLGSPRRLADIPEIKLPDVPMAGEPVTASADVLAPEAAPALKPPMTAGAATEVPPMGGLNQPLFLGGPGRFPAVSSSAPASSIPSGVSPASTSSGSATPVASSDVPSANPPMSTIPEPSSCKLMLLILVPCIVLLGFRKFAATE